MLDVRQEMLDVRQEMLDKLLTIEKLMNYEASIISLLESRQRTLDKVLNFYILAHKSTSLNHQSITHKT